MDSPQAQQLPAGPQSVDPPQIGEARMEAMAAARVQAEAAHREAVTRHEVAEAELRALQAVVQTGGELEPSELIEATARVEHAALRLEAKRRQLAKVPHIADPSSALRTIDLRTAVGCDRVTAHFRDS